jgi:dimethylglycine dehydrogenase
MTDVALIERGELTAGSSWHAAGGFHAINSDTSVGKDVTLEALEELAEDLESRIDALKEEM